MILKFKSKRLKKNNNILQKLLISYFIITFSIISLFTIFFFSSYAFKVKTGQVLEYFSKAGRIEYLNIFEIVFRGIQSKFIRFDKIELDIDFNEIVKIEKDRALALKRGTLGINDNLTMVDGILKHNGKELNAKIRLKGGRKMHWEEKKTSSYNFYLEDDQYLMGMSTFTIHKPGARNYIHEWIFHEMMGDFGLIKLNYHFFHLYINGESHGLYALEEKLSKEIIERNQRRNGPIFTSVNFINSPDEIAALKIYKEKYWSRPENIELAQIATNKLSNFLKGERELEDTFNLEKLAAWLAVMDATYTLHGLPFNSKLYYNPVDGLFEPIPRDGHRTLPNYHKINKNYYRGLIIDSLNQPESVAEHGVNVQITEGRWSWIDKFFNKNGELNKDFYNKYLSYLNKISKEDYYKNFLKKRKEQIYKINSNIYGDISFYSTTRNYGSGIYYFNKKDLKNRFEYIQNRLQTIDKSFFVRLIEKNKLEVRVQYPFYNDPLRRTKLTNITLDSILCLNNKKLNINKQLNLGLYTFIDLSEKVFNEHNCKQVLFKDHISNSNQITDIDELNNYLNFKSDLSYKNTLFLKYFDIKKNLLTLKNKQQIISENIYIPKGFLVEVFPNETIILKNNSFIFSDSPWNVDGRMGQISIRGEKENFGGGLIINNVKKRSKFINVKFSYLTGYKRDYFDKETKKRYSSKTSYFPDTNQFKERLYEKEIFNNSNEFLIMGSINFHNTSVDIKKVLFENISSEDALNIINSEFSINEIKFKNNKSDSIDFDFSNGSLENAEFYNIGNDAIDFSGSKASIKDINFYEVNDKLISVGENSDVNISNIYANKSYVGIASKDGSVVKANKIKMENINFPFLSFNKKFEYDIANLFIENIDIKNYTRKWLIDKNSKIFFENSSVGKIFEKIIPLVYRKDIDLIDKSS